MLKSDEILALGNMDHAIPACFFSISVGQLLSVQSLTIFQDLPKLHSSICSAKWPYLVETESNTLWSLVSQNVLPTGLSCIRYSLDICFIIYSFCFLIVQYSPFSWLTILFGIKTFLDYPPLKNREPVQVFFCEFSSSGNYITSYIRTQYIK